MRAEIASSVLVLLILFAVFRINLVALYLFNLVLKLWHHWLNNEVLFPSDSLAIYSNSSMYILGT